MIAKAASLVDSHGAPIKSDRLASFRKEQNQRRMLTARFDSAQTTADNQRHWRFADHFSANQSNLHWVRKVLISRSRYEFSNNSYMNGQVDTMANDLIGRGPGLDIAVATPIGREIERAWRLWTKRIRLAQKLRTARREKAVAGEGFIVMFTNRKLRGPVQLDVRVVPAEKITTPTMENIVAPNFIDGIRFDEFGNPIEYDELIHHPGDLQLGGIGRDPLAVRVLPAEAVIHWFEIDRAEQFRGLPEFTPSLQNYAEIRRYCLAVIAAAETAADYAAVLKTDLPLDSDQIATAAEIAPLDVVELEKRMATTLPHGWDLQQVKTEQPPTGYKEFKREQLGEAARCVSMPLNIATGDSSGYNFASGRLDHQTYGRSLDVEHSDLELVGLDTIFFQFIDEYLIGQGVREAGRESILTDLIHEWTWPPREHVDPQKNATALIALWDKGLITDDEYLQQRNILREQWEMQVMRQQEFRAEAGLPMPGGVSAAPPPEDESEPEPEDEAAEAEDEIEETEPAGVS